MSKRKKQPKQTPLYDVIADADKLKCGSCGNVAPYDDYDCIGADHDCLFCPECHEHVNAFTGAVVPVRDEP